MFGDPPIDFSRIADLAGLATYARVRSRVGDLPEVLGSLPAAVMAKEMTTPGKGQIRAMFFSAGNPVLSRCRTATNSSERSRARAVGRDRPLRHGHLAPLRLRPPGNDDVRARGPPAAVPRPVQHAVHPDDRGGGRAARRGSAGVGGDRRALEADRRGPVERLGSAAARQARRAAVAAPARRSAAARRPQGRPVRAAPRRAQPREAARRPARDRARRASARRASSASRSATRASGSASTRR